MPLREGKRAVVGVESYLLRFARIRPGKQRSAVAQRHSRTDATFTVTVAPLITTTSWPVEPIRLARRKP